MIADMWAMSRHRLVLIERDGGRGVTATFRRVYVVDVRRTDASGFLEKTMVVDLTSIPDPDEVSLPAIHPGDLGLGDPFWVMCESVEAIHLIGGQRLLIGCDNNFPNSGRNPTLPDDNELIVVRVPGLRS
jgi:glycerophosphoryl diester phosphodiesterase